MSSPRISALTTGMSRSAAMHARAKNDMKPSPIPCCFWKRSLCSARSARTVGASASTGASRAAGEAGAGFGAASGAAGAGFGAAGAAARAPPSSSMRATSSPTTTFSPAAFTMRSTPARSAGSSMLALSVSSSSRMSSGLTASPSCFAQRTMTPSVTDSPSVGLRTSHVMPPSASAPLSAGERGVHQVALLGLMELERAGRGARGLGTPGVVEGAVLGQDAPESPVHDVPRAHVPRLLLHPVHLTRFGVGGQDGLGFLRREGVELLDAHERHGVDGALAARGEELVVDLAAAEQDAPHPAALDRDPGLGRAAERDVVDHGPEPALRQLCGRRDAA